ncbi:MAG: hypothetical protein CL783_00025 [Chloroflexi bacterium]|nr:hypothetical protein [Chloroflexota bacterium]|tara:strand:- start:5648 stop:7111 length:1464 start_codon:yes stop_codon:yes gene_type:complete
MTILLNDLQDLTLSNLERIAHSREKVRFGSTALLRLQAAHTEFKQFVKDNPQQFIYGVTSGYGPNAKHKISAKERKRLKELGMPFIGLSFGDGYLPETKVRAMVFAILALFLRGGAAVSKNIAQDLAKSLDGDMPRIPAGGLTSPGEILPLFYLMRLLPDPSDNRLQASTGNTACCSAGMASVAAIEANRRLIVAQKAFALSYDAIQAPLEHIDPALKQLWGDPFEARAIDNLSTLLKGTEEANRRPFQAPVSYRILPRLLGQALRSGERLSVTAEENLQSMVSNPIFFPQGSGSKVEAISTGGYHNSLLPQALDGMAMSWVDLAEIARRHIIKLHKGPISRLPDRLVRDGDTFRTGRTTSYIEFVAADFVDEMKRWAEPSLLSPGEPGASEQDDINAMGYIACRNEARVAILFDRVMALLAAVSSHALAISDRTAPINLEDFTREIRRDFPPVTKKRELGKGAEKLTNRLSTAIEHGGSVLTKRIS